MMGLHPDELEEMGYADRCKETLLAELRAEHQDHFEDWFEEADEEVTWEPEPAPEPFEFEDIPF